MDDAFAVVAPERDLVLGPQAGELGRATEKLGDQRVGLGILGRPACRRGAQVGDERPRLPLVVLLEVEVA
jgi:hypothetical protein